MVVTVGVDPARSDEAGQILEGIVVPASTGAEGFVRGIWLRSMDGTSGLGVVVFDTEAHARALAEQATEGPPPGAAVTPRSIEVFEVVAEA
jgi:hypothetical protein